MTADYLYYGALDGSVYCLDRSNGAVAWSHVCGRPIPGSPALGGNMVLLGCTDNKIYALANGEEV
jgi:outer membrane protein assembly factor BamB